MSSDLAELNTSPDYSLSLAAKLREASDLPLRNTKGPFPSYSVNPVWTDIKLCPRLESLHKTQIAYPVPIGLSPTVDMRMAQVCKGNGLRRSVSGPAQALARRYITAGAQTAPTVRAGTTNRAPLARTIHSWQPISSRGTLHQSKNNFRLLHSPTTATTARCMSSLSLGRSSRLINSCIVTSKANSLVFRTFYSSGAMSGLFFQRFYPLHTFDWFLIL
jgi:hypothetical protein